MTNIPNKEALVIALGSALLQRGFKLVTAESCTGGGLSYFVTSAPGSSDWFERGFVTYSNTAKVEMLGVNLQTITSFGAVSAETAVEMANGALKHSHANVSIAITGVAGPTGGTPQTPVGTVWIAWAKTNRLAEAKRYIFSGDRQTIRTLSIENALQGLLIRL